MSALPPVVVAVAPLRAGAGAVEATRTTRLAASLLSDVHAGAVAGPTAADGWWGLARRAADDHGRALAREVDVVVAVLEVAVRGLEAFEQEVADLLARRDRLAGWATAYAAGVRAAAARPPDAQVTAALWAEHDEIAREAERLLTDELVAEDALVRAWESVDSDAEARPLATEPDRPDAGGLARGLASVVGRPDVVRRWWGTLSTADREALLIAEPDLVVNADGVPVTARDDAGRAALARDLPEADGREREHLDALAAALAAGSSALLLRYAPRGDGRGAVAYGNPDTADRTAVLVPGLGTDLSSIDGLGERARDVRAEAAAQAPGSVAAVTWVGYDAPDFTIESASDLLDGASVLSDDRAHEGGHDLVDFVDGLRASDEEDPSRLTVVGHSYGSTTTAWAAAEGLDADAVVLVGSPGAGGAEHAADLGSTSGTEVYVGSRDHDPVTWLGGRAVGLGADPAQADFGEVRIDVGEGRSFGLDEIGSVGFGDNHSSYFEPGSTSLDSIAAVVDGSEPDTVPGREHSARAFVLELALEEGRRQVEGLGDRLTFWD